MPTNSPDSLQPQPAQPNQPARQDRTIKLLHSVIAGALTLIALRPFIAPLPAQAQNGAFRPEFDA